MTVTIVQGVPEGQIDAAARLYWQAFGGKLGMVMGPEARALDYLRRAISPAHVICALDAAGQVVGVAGFKSPAGSFAGGQVGDIAHVYGRLGALWREWVLQLLSGEVDNDRFLIDGISVDRKHRSQGLGSRLVEALCDEARARGYSHIRLDVIDTNWRAKALYGRLGFVVETTQPIGWLRYVFGFAAATTMVRSLTDEG